VALEMNGYSTHSAQDEEPGQVVLNNILAVSTPAKLYTCEEFFQIKTDLAVAREAAETE
jgi:hypothetical protein